MCAHSSLKLALLLRIPAHHVAFKRRKASPAGKAAEDGGSCGCQETAFFRRLENEVNHINK